MNGRDYVLTEFAPALGPLVALSLLEKPLLPPLCNSSLRYGFRDEKDFSTPALVESLPLLGNLSDREPDLPGALPVVL